VYTFITIISYIANHGYLHAANDFYSVKKTIVAKFFSEMQKINFSLDLLLFLDKWINDVIIDAL